MLHQCGWPLRLSSRALESAILARTRIQLLPSHHPSRQTFETAVNLTVGSWSHKLDSLLTEYGLREIPDIAHHSLFTSQELATAICAPDIRKNLVRRFKWDVVRPLFLVIDRQHFQEQLQKAMGCFTVPFSVLSPSSFLFRTEMLAHAGGPATWTHFRVWTLARMTGKWPRLGESAVEFDHSRAWCPHCGISDVDLAHALAECDEVPVSYDHVFGSARRPPRQNSEEVLIFLFGDFIRDSDISLAMQRVCYVGCVLHGEVSA